MSTHFAIVSYITYRVLCITMNSALFTCRDKVSYVNFTTSDNSLEFQCLPARLGENADLLRARDQIGSIEKPSIYASQSTSLAAPLMDTTSLVKLYVSSSW